MNHLLAPLVFSDSVPGRATPLGGVSPSVLAPNKLEIPTVPIDAPTAPDTRTVALARARAALLADDSGAGAPRRRRSAGMIALLKRGLVYFTSPGRATAEEAEAAAAAHMPMPSRPATALPSRPATSIG